MWGIGKFRDFPHSEQTCQSRPEGFCITRSSELPSAVTMTMCGPGISWLHGKAYRFCHFIELPCGYRICGVLCLSEMGVIAMNDCNASLHGLNKAKPKNLSDDENGGTKKNTRR